MKITLEGDEIHKIFKEVETKDRCYILPKNIFILNFLQKAIVSYGKKYNLKKCNDFLLLPNEETYKLLDYKNSGFIIFETDILTIENVSNSEEDLFYFKMKYGD